MPGIYLFRTRGKPSTWVNVKSMEVTRQLRKSIETITYHSLASLRLAMDVLEYNYGHPGIEVDEIVPH